MTTVVAAASWDDVLEIPIGSTVTYVFKMYKADGFTPDVIESGDVVRFKVWKVGSEASDPAIDADSTADVSAAFTADVTNVITSTSHGLSIDDAIQFTTTNALPGGLLTRTDYFVREVLSANTFKVALTKGGTEVDVTDTGTGSHTWAESKSRVDVVSLGTPSVPAEFNVRVDQTDTVSLEANSEYVGQLAIVDHSESGKIKPIMRGPIIPLATSQGDKGLT